MKTIKTKVVHSQTKPAWNVVGTEIGDPYKVARVPYTPHPSDVVADSQNRKEAYELAEFISACFNRASEITNEPEEKPFIKAQPKPYDPTKEIE